MPKAKAASATATAQVIELPKLNIVPIQLHLVGDSPLIVHAWSKKAKQEMLDKQMKKAKQGRQAKDPQQDYKDSLYLLPSSTSRKPRYGFPAVAFKAAAVDACSHISGITKVEARGAFHVQADEGDLVEIFGTPTMREDMVKIAMGTADIRYRGEFREWYTRLTIRLNTNLLTPEQVANLFNTAGFGVGIGEWRPQRDGQFGMFHVAEEADLKRLKIK